MALKKGIILAGGKGTRLFPSTAVICKPLLPVYDKPMIYYPLSTLIQAGVTDILMITTPSNVSHFDDLFGDGSHLGLNISYEAQNKPLGIAHAFIVGEQFIGNDPVALILGDNIFFGDNNYLSSVSEFSRGAQVYAVEVKDPERFGIVEFDETGRTRSIEEKPDQPKSNFAVVGLYIYEPSVIEVARQLEPSARGELEITHVNEVYLDRNQLRTVKLPEGTTWIDAGTGDSMLEASYAISKYENKTGRKVGCIEEAAFCHGRIDAAQLMKIAGAMPESPYREYLEQLVTEHK